jgi:aminopeptidase
MGSDFEHKLQRYAELGINIGLNLRPGQRILIRAPVQTIALVRAAAESAYQHGARLVDVHWTDEEIDRMRFQHAPRDSFDEYPAWLGTGLLEYVERGDAIFSISADNPDLYKGQDSALVSAVQQARARTLRPALELLGTNATNWLVIAAPTAGWADKVFPNEPAEHRQQRLWEAIFDICRVNTSDPVAAWAAHLRQLDTRSDYLNTKGYRALKYRAPGTELTIGLPDGHIWVSGQSISRNGILFTANLPTEEVFTIPHAQQTSGVVSSG